MKSLYPIIFEPICMEKVWGGNKLVKLLNKQVDEHKPYGESWEIAQLGEIDSFVENGFLKGNTLSEIIEIYMNELLGDQVYLKYGEEFPLLFKFIDANDKLSIQVHPDNEVAQYRHNAYGKCEMWYVVDAEPNAQIILGFKEKIDKQKLFKAIEDKSLSNLLNYENVKKGDVFYIPSGTVHALLKGVVVAEIQQNSDITYRLYDWDRPDLDGKPRKLHIELALDVINYDVQKNLVVKYQIAEQKRIPLVANAYFTTNLISFDNSLVFDYSKLDSFVVCMCVDGSFDLKTSNNDEIIKISKGQTVLIPAEIEEVTLMPNEKCVVLETYIPFVYVDQQN